MNKATAKGTNVNRKVWIVTELTDDICIGTVGQIVGGEGRISKLSEVVRDIVKEMDGDDVMDSEGIELTIQIR